jgi:hypothetical protein
VSTSDADRLPPPPPPLCFSSLLICSNGLSGDLFVNAFGGNIPAGRRTSLAPNNDTGLAIEREPKQDEISSFAQIKKQYSVLCVIHRFSRSNVIETADDPQHIVSLYDSVHK